MKRAVFRLALAAMSPLLLLPTAPARGDAVGPPPEGSFTLVIMPDTQHYTDVAGRATIFISQTQWVAENRDRYNIKYVLHEGDVVQDNLMRQWDIAKQAFGRLDDAGIPHAISPGNHDYGPVPRKTFFNDRRYFGPGSPYANQPSVGGFFEEGRTDNSFHTFAAGGRDWLILALEWSPREVVMGWARGVLEAHPDHVAILLVHTYLGGNGLRNSSGSALWNQLVSLHNVAFVFCGHVTASSRLTSIGAFGQVVHQILANYQHLILGGNGYMRLLEILPDGRTVRIQTYSPFRDQVMTKTVEQFDLVLCGVPEDPETDINENALPDECEPDCNKNGTPDGYDIMTGSSVDDNRNAVPDECDLRPAFTMTPVDGEEPLEVRVDAGASVTRGGDSIISYEWDFGDGVVGEGVVASHVYTRPGQYQVSCRVADDGGLTAEVAESVTVNFRPGDVAPWTSADVGAVGVRGGARREADEEDDCFTVFASGWSLSSASDRLHFLYREVSGEVVLTARIDGVEAIRPRWTVGLMVRDGLDPGAPHVAVTLRHVTDASRRFTLFHRTLADRRSRRVSMPESVGSTGYVRIERHGDVITSAVSEDGTTWSDFTPQSLPLADTILVGVALSANGSIVTNATVQASVRDLRLALPEFRRGDANRSGGVDLSDGIAILQYLFLGGVVLPCLDAADTNDSGHLDIVDSVAIFAYLMMGMPAPDTPGPESCGIDPSVDRIGCSTFQCE